MRRYYKNLDTPDKETRTVEIIFLRAKGCQGTRKFSWPFCLNSRPAPPSVHAVGNKPPSGLEPG